MAGVNYTITINKGAHKTTHPYKLTYIDKEFKKFVKDCKGYAMFAWVFKTKEKAEESARKDLKEYKDFTDRLKVVR